MRLLIQNLVRQSIACIKHNIPFFISLVLLHTLIMISLVVSSDWVENNIVIYPFSIGPIILRMSLFCFVLGIWIGFFKLILALIDKKKRTITSIFQYFYLLPKVLLARLISYCTVIPGGLFIINKFPYDFEKHGINIEQYIADLLYNISTIYSDEISWNLYFAYFNYTDIGILIILVILPLYFMLRFWCLEIILIDNECGIKESFLLSYTLTKKSIYQFILLGIITSLINIIMMFLGFIFFILSLTISYIIMFQYYRLLLKQTRL